MAPGQVDVGTQRVFLAGENMLGNRSATERRKRGGPNELSAPAVITTDTPAPA